MGRNVERPASTVFHTAANPRSSFGFGCRGKSAPGIASVENCARLQLADQPNEGRYTGFHRWLVVKHGQQVTEVGVVPLVEKTCLEKPASVVRASLFS